MDINNAIDTAIDALADGDINQGADQLYELSVAWAKADMPQRSFEDLRGYIIQEAMEKTDHYFIIEKLKIIERANRDRRNRTAKNKKIQKDNTRIIR